MNIMFTDNGGICEVRSLVPGVATVVGTKHREVGHDVTIVLPSLYPVVLTPEQSSLSTLSVVRSTARAKGCHPVTADGLIISSGVRRDSTLYDHYVITSFAAFARRPLTPT